MNVVTLFMNMRGECQIPRIEPVVLITDYLAHGTIATREETRGDDFWIVRIEFWIDGFDAPPSVATCPTRSRLSTDPLE